MHNITLMINKGPITLVLKVFFMSSTLLVWMVPFATIPALFTSRFKPLFPSRDPTFFADSLTLDGSSASSSNRTNFSPKVSSNEMVFKKHKKISEILTNYF